MNRILGFFLFAAGLGVLIGILIPNHFLAVLLAACLLLAGYNLFCCQNS